MRDADITIRMPDDVSTVSLLPSHSAGQSILEPHEDRILSMSVLGERWGIHPKVALNRAKKLNLPIIRFNARSLGVKLSAVLKAEQEATV
jgi:hypothetical protein